MKIQLITTAAVKISAACGLIFLALGLPSAVLAGGGDKVLACHITGMNLDQDRFIGNVISISENALGAHCAHGGVSDHRPNGVIEAALEECDTMDEASRCVIKYATGRFCSRSVTNTNAVDALCNPSP